jgi:hypothetical protein
MNRFDLSTGAARLDKAWKKLAARWDATQAEWRDPVSRGFEEHHLHELHAQVNRVLERMRALSGVLATAQHECDDRPHDLG